MMMMDAGDAKTYATNTTDVADLTVEAQVEKQCLCMESRVCKHVGK